MPDQPELRQRLTRVLRDHSETLDIRKYRYGCVCGEWTGANLAEHWGHVADVLLSLPGIAITVDPVWYITTDLLERGGRVIAGPFPTAKAATMMRKKIECYSGNKTYWIDKGRWAAAGIAEEHHG